LKLKGDLNENIEDKNHKETINLEKEHKQLQNEYQNLSDKYNVQELKVKELEKKNNEQENNIKQLQSKIEKISKASELNSDKNKYIYKKKIKNKVEFDKINNNNNNSGNNNNYYNYYNNNNNIYFNSSSSNNDNNNCHHNNNSSNNNYIFNSNNNDNFINYNNNGMIYNNNSINNGIFSNNNLNNNYNYNFDNYINNNLAQFNKAPFVGLIDVGGSKFMNSILRCLCQTMPLTNYFLDLNNKNNILKNQNKLQLSPLYLELNENLWNNQTGNNIYKPYSFVNMIQSINNNNYKIEKGKDFILFILDKLDKELSQLNNQNNKYNKYNKYDKIKVFEYFFNEFKQKTSIISEIFVGFMESRNECLYCKPIYQSQNEDYPIYYTYEIFKYLVFPLDKIKDMKNNNNISIYDCFEYNQIDKKDNNYCYNCKNNRDFNISSRIFVGPNILIIILENENNNPYVKLDIQLTIDLTNYILKKDNPIYDLYGIVSYFRNNTPSPYMACCLNQKDNKWYKFNNEYINQINDIQKDFIESGSPSILFYKKQIYNSGIFNNLFNN